MNITILIRLIKENSDYEPRRKRDERGEYVYDYETGEDMFRDDIAESVTLLMAGRDWCDAHKLTPF